MKIEVYHGSIVKVEAPVCNMGRENLDFGRGFYLTNYTISSSVSRLKCS